MSFQLSVPPGAARRFGGMLTVLLLISSAPLGIGNAHGGGGDEPQYAKFYTPPGG